MKKDFDDLREQLGELAFPTLYLFKFIIKSDVQKITQIESLFHSERAQINHKQPSNRAFVSISLKEVMLSADEIIEFHVQASKVEGVIVL